MDSHETKNLHSGYIDGALTEEQQNRLNAHLAECGQCQADLEALTQTVALVSSCIKEPAPPEFITGVMESVRREAPGLAREPKRPTIIQLLMPALKGVAAVLVLGVAFKIAVDVRGPGESPASVGSDQPPRSAGKDKGNKELMAEAPPKDSENVDTLAFANRGWRDGMKLPLSELARRFDESEANGHSDFKEKLAAIKTEEDVSVAALEILDRGGRSLLTQSDAVVVSDNAAEVLTAKQAISPSRVAQEVNDASFERMYARADDGEREVQLRGLAAGVPGGKGFSHNLDDSTSNRATAFSQVRAIEATLATAREKDVEELVSYKANLFVAADQQGSVRQRRSKDNTQAYLYRKAMRKDLEDVKDEGKLDSESAGASQPQDATAGKGKNDDRALPPLQLQLECYQLMELLPREEAKPNEAFVEKHQLKIIPRSQKYQDIAVLQQILFPGEQVGRITRDANGRSVLVAELTEPEYQAFNKQLDNLQPHYTTLASTVRARLRPAPKLIQPPKKKRFATESEEADYRAAEKQTEAKRGVLGKEARGENRITVVIIMRPDLVETLERYRQEHLEKASNKIK